MATENMDTNTISSISFSGMKQVKEHMRSYITAYMCRRDIQHIYIYIYNFLKSSMINCVVSLTTEAEYEKKTMDKYLKIYIKNIHLKNKL